MHKPVVHAWSVGLNSCDSDRSQAILTWAWLGVAAGSTGPGAVA